MLPKDAQVFGVFSNFSGEKRGGVSHVVVNALVRFRRYDRQARFQKYWLFEGLEQVLSPCMAKVVSVEPFQFAMVSALERVQDLYEDRALERFLESVCVFRRYFVCGFQIAFRKAQVPLRCVSKGLIPRHDRVNSSRVSCVLLSLGFALHYFEVCRCLLGIGRLSSGTVLFAACLAIACLTDYKLSNRPFNPALNQALYIFLIFSEANLSIF
jgi:hypothetical protein